MRKLFALGTFAVISLFLPSRSQAVPIDVPYQLLFSTTATTTLTISSTTFPSPSAAVNSNVASYQWCLERGEITVPSGAANFSIYWSTSSFGFNTGTTDYLVITGTATPYAMPLNYRTPYCAPIGATTVTVKSSAAGAVINAGGYLFKGWNP